MPAADEQDRGLSARRVPAGRPACADAGCLKISAGSAFLGDHAMVHEHDAVGDLAGEVHLVGDDEHGHAARGEVAHDGQHLADQLGVERAGDLVEQHRLGLHGERPGDGDPLLLPARQLLGIVVGAVGEANLAQQRLGPLARRGVGQLSTWRGASITLSSAVMCGNRLKAWNTMPIWARMRAISRGGCSDGAPSTSSRKAGWPSMRTEACLGHLQPVQAAQEGRLAGAGRAR